MVHVNVYSHWKEYTMDKLSNNVIQYKLFLKKEDNNGLYDLYSKGQKSKIKCKCMLSNTYCGYEEESD